MNLIGNNEIIVCNEKTVENIKGHAKLLIKFLEQTSVLTEAYILDFFVENLWMKLPASWQETLNNFEPQDLELFLNFNSTKRCKNPWPLSLLSFRACAFGLSLSRKSIQSLQPIENFLAETLCLKTVDEKKEPYSGNISWDPLKLEFEDKSGQHKSIPEFCRRHVKPKKQHEIFRVAQVTALIMRAYGITHALDVGSGQGHLSRFLALCYNLNVATVEANQCHVSGAKNFDKQAFCTLKRLKNFPKPEKCEENMAMLPHHLEGSITPESSNLYLSEIFNKAWTKNFPAAREEEFALLGLHTCGNLATTLLKLFTTCDHAKVLLSVGCCYMKMNSDVMANEGFPLSSYMRSLQHHLSYEANELACHALEMFIQRLKREAATLKIHCYRATLEKCIIHHYPEAKHLGLRGVKHAEVLEFSEYAEKALNKVPYSIPKDYFSLPEVQACLMQWKKVLTFYSVRLAIAPVIESLILLDRMIYLFEKGYTSCIAPIFDPSLSPRNLVLISIQKP